MQSGLTSLNGSKRNCKQLRYSRVCDYTYVMEVIGECPSENASRVAERLQEVMVDSAKDVCSVRMKCDLYKVYRWYADDFSNTVKEMYDKAIEKGTNSVSAKNEILQKYDFVSPSVLDDMISGTFDVETRTDI